MELKISIHLGDAFYLPVFSNVPVSVGTFIKSNRFTSQLRNFLCNLCNKTCDHVCGGVSEFHKNKSVTIDSNNNFSTYIENVLQPVVLGWGSILTGQYSIAHSQADNEVPKTFMTAML